MTDCGRFLDCIESLEADRRLFSKASCTLIFVMASCLAADCLSVRYYIYFYSSSLLFRSMKLIFGFAR